MEVPWDPVCEPKERRERKDSFLVMDERLDDKLLSPTVKPCIEDNINNSEQQSTGVSFP